MDTPGQAARSVSVGLQKGAGIAGSIPSKEYAAGLYFADPTRHSEDGPFKAAECLRLLSRHQDRKIRSIADVGCGSGAAVIEVYNRLRNTELELVSACAYDVSPHVKQLEHPFVRFVHGDFAESSESVDLVTLFDVVEHVPDPIAFLKGVATHGNVLCVHMPLDESLNLAIRNLWRRNLGDPGHLLVLDAAAALNLLAFAGLRVLDYIYTPCFRAPSGHATPLAKVAYLVRRTMFALSPWLLSKTLGGVSMMLLASKSAAMTELESNTE